MLKNGICTNQNQSWKMRYIQFSGTLKCRQIYQIAIRKQVLINKKKEEKPCHQVDIAIKEDHRMKTKEYAKINKCLDPAR